MEDIKESIEERVKRLEEKILQDRKSDERVEELRLRANLFEGAVHNLKASLNVSNRIISEALVKNDFVSLRKALIEVQLELVKALHH